MSSVHINYKNVLLRLIAIMAFLLSSACSDRYVPEEEEPQLPCKLRGACDSTVIKYIKHFNKRGVKVITKGQDYLISIPAGALFADQTPHLTWASYSLLNEVATFLKQFRKVAITISSFSSKYVSVQRERSLTLARSRVVGEYLWSQGIDSRLVFTQGLGSDKPIMSFAQGGDASPNARVEITFRDAVA